MAFLELASNKKEMNVTEMYRALQVTEPGRLEIVQRELPIPEPGQV
jgi:hypothetical protein